MPDALGEVEEKPLKHLTGCGKEGREGDKFWTPTAINLPSEA